MSKVLAKSKINNTTVKFIELKSGFKVSYSGFYRTFEKIEKAAEYYADTVSHYVKNDARNVVDDYNRENKIAEQLKEL